MKKLNEAIANQLVEIVKNETPTSILFVCSKAYDRYGYRDVLDSLDIKLTAFTEFEPCPEISSVDKGVETFKSNNCDFIIAVGGGSAIDVAKGIKYYAQSDVRILAIPTTAGTGAEVTRFSVLYNNADKQSIRSWDIIPELQIFDASTLETLPYIQKVVTSLDAFTHAVEAYWSKDATDESRAYSVEALKLFNDNFDRYIKNDESTYEAMLKCSELAGRAINIAQTTACHAFSYKLHKLKGFYHGQAVAVCLVYIWRYMEQNGFDSSKVREVSGFTPDSLEDMLKSLGLLDDLTMTEAQLDETINGVDENRLQNHPMSFAKDDIASIYKSFINANI